MSAWEKSKIAVSANGPDPDSLVAQRFGIAPYLMIADTKTLDWESVPNPGAEGGPGSAMQTVVLAISKDVNIVLTGSCGPVARKYLTNHGIAVITGIVGTVSDALEHYMRGDFREEPISGKRSFIQRIVPDGIVLQHALKNAARQFAGLLPTLMGVILLIGLFKAFISQRLVSSIFSGNALWDSLRGVCFGSVIAGNPINSYILGGELLDYGVSLFAVTSLIVAWVSVGIVQLPAEIAALGKRFALLRAALAFVMSWAAAFCTVLIVNLFSGK